MVFDFKGEKEDFLSEEDIFSESELLLYHEF